MLKTFMGNLANAALLFATFFITTGSAAGANLQFDRNLYFGLRNDTSVIRLQDALKNLGFFPAQTASTGNYFNLTVEAVKKFQIANGVKPASGFFGPLTRAKINRLQEPRSPRIEQTAPQLPSILLGTGRSGQALPASKTATSTYWERIRISYINRSEKPEDEYITIENTSTTSERISITGFKLVNSSGDEFEIPKGHNIPGLSAVPEDNIILAQYDSAKITVGRQEKRINFRENICTGYLDEDGSFRGQISRSCPKPNITANLKLPDHCIRVFEAASSCRTIDSSRIQVSECLDFAEAHYNYQGCVKDSRDRKDFYKRNWLIWMQKSANFVRAIHDKITLLDKEGKIVSVFTF